MGNITSSVTGPIIILIVGSLLVACFAVINILGNGKEGQDSSAGSVPTISRISTIKKVGDAQVEQKSFWSRGIWR